MLIDTINELNLEIYRGNLKDVDMRIVEIISKALNEGVKDQMFLLELMKRIEIEIVNKNYVYISDLLKFELTKILINT